MTTDLQASWTRENHVDFHNEVLALLRADGMASLAPETLSEILVDHLDREMQKRGCPIEPRGARFCIEHVITGLNADADGVQETPGSGDEKKEAIADYLAHYAEECISDVRWPMGNAYVNTGHIPDHYAQNTTATVVVVDKDGQVVGAEVIHWSDFAKMNDDECYRAFRKAIEDAAMRFGARSFYTFYISCQPSSRVAIAYGEQGPTFFHACDYRDDTKRDRMDRETEAEHAQTATGLTGNDSEIDTDHDFLAELDRIGSASEAESDHVQDNAEPQQAKPEETHG